MCWLDFSPKYIYTSSFQENKYYFLYTYKSNRLIFDRIKAHALPRQISSIIIRAGFWTSNELTLYMLDFQIFRQKHKHLSVI